MARLINADDIKYTDMLAPMGNGNYEHVGIVTESDIDAMPTVDAVPVVRCKDCTHVLPQGMYGDWYMCEMWDKQIHTSLSGYCNKAKRKEE